MPGLRTQAVTRVRVLLGDVDELVVGSDEGAVEAVDKTRWVTVWQMLVVTSVVGGVVGVFMLGVGIGTYATWAVVTALVALAIGLVAWNLTDWAEAKAWPAGTTKSGT